MGTCLNSTPSFDERRKGVDSIGEYHGQAQAVAAGRGDSAGP